MFAEPTAPQKRGWPPIARGESTLILAPTGSGKTLTAFLWSLNRLMFEPVPERRSAVPRPVHFAAQGAGRGRGAQPARAARGDLERRRRPGHAVSHAVDCRPHRRHAGRRAREVPAGAGRHPDHDAGVAVPAADLERAREPAVGGDGDHRRDSRAGVDQARRAPGAVARTARTDCARAAAADWPVGDAAAAGRSGAVPRRCRTCSRDTKRPRRTRSQDRQDRAQKTDFADSVHDEFEDDRTVKYRPVTIVDASAPKKLAITVQTPVEDMAAMGKPVEQPSGPASQGPVAQSIWSSIHPKLVELIRVASLDAAVRQQPAARRAAGRRAQRDRRRAAGARASRIAGARAADRDRRSAEGRAPARAGGDLVARARHRHGRDRPGDPDRGAAVGGQRPAAHRPRRPQHRSGQRRHHLPEVSAATWWRAPR